MMVSVYGVAIPWINIIFTESSVYCGKTKWYIVDEYGIVNKVSGCTWGGRGMM